MKHLLWSIALAVVFTPLLHAQYNDYGLIRALQEQAAFSNTYGGSGCASRVPTNTQLEYADGGAATVGWLNCMQYEVGLICDIEFTTQNGQTLCKEDRMGLTYAWYNWDWCVNDNYWAGQMYFCDPPGGWPTVFILGMRRARLLQTQEIVVHGLHWSDTGWRSGTVDDKQFNVRHLNLRDGTNWIASIGLTQVGGKWDVNATCMTGFLHRENGSFWHISSSTEPTEAVVRSLQRKVEQNCLEVPKL